MNNSRIEWTDTTWNPTTGCTKVSPGCDRCYAETIHERFHGKGSFAIVSRSDSKLYAPMTWRKPRRVFVNSMSDLFHDDVPDSFIAKTFSVMARTPQHAYQLLTKRHGRMRSLLTSPAFADLVQDLTDPTGLASVWPLPNLWLGVSVEDQKRADLRIPALLDTPAAIRWLSCEPLLGPIDLAQSLSRWNPNDDQPWSGNWLPAREVLHWVVAGGESGHGARPMDPSWARGLRDQCATARIPFFFKQWGEWAPAVDLDPDLRERAREQLVGQEYVCRVGKKAAGRDLDGRTWDQYPAELQAVAAR